MSTCMSCSARTYVLTYTPEYTFLNVYLPTCRWCPLVRAAWEGHPAQEPWVHAAGERDASEPSYLCGLSYLCALLPRWRALPGDQLPSSLCRLRSSRLGQPLGGARDTVWVRVRVRVRVRVYEGEGEDEGRGLRVRGEGYSREGTLGSGTTFMYSEPHVQRPPRTKPPF